MSAPFWFNVYDRADGRRMTGLSDHGSRTAADNAGLLATLRGWRRVYRIKVTPKVRHD